jgi:hypothetical protein
LRAIVGGDIDDGGGVEGPEILDREWLRFLNFDSFESREVVEDAADGVLSF